MKRDEQREALLQKTCHVIDVLPVAVPKESASRFLEVEQFYLTPPEREKLAEKWVRIAMGLLSYFDAEAYTGNWLESVSCRALASRIRRLSVEGRGDLTLLFPKENALLRMEGDALHLTVYHATGQLREILRALAAAEGLFWREGAE